MPIPTVNVISKTFTDIGVEVVAIVSKGSLVFECTIESNTSFYDTNYDGENYLTNADQLLTIRKKLGEQYGAEVNGSTNGVKFVNDKYKTNLALSFTMPHSHWMARLWFTNTQAFKSLPDSLKPDLELCARDIADWIEDNCGMSLGEYLKANCGVSDSLILDLQTALKNEV